MINRLTKTLLLMMVAISLAFPGQKTCNYCNKKVDGRYIVFETKTYHQSCYQTHVQVRCDHCSKKIDGQYSIYDDKNYHAGCYKKYIQIRCDHCGNTISDAFNIDNDKKYHKACYVNNILEKCDACLNPLEGKYNKDYWGNIYHQKHNNEFPSCDNCNRLICARITQGGYTIDKKRNICSLCYPKVVMKQNQIKDLAKEVKGALSAIGINNIPSNIPISLVNSMDELDHIVTIRLGNVRGYTHYNVNTLAGKKIKEEFHIYVLSNLHELAFKAVLAHEYLHVYLFQNDYDLESDLREGFCNLGSQLMLTKDNSVLSNYLLDSMYESDDPDYGKGFIKMNSMLERKGWNKLLNDLVKL
jgi:DNA-directed RNA polymerase subunit N (RpoN/RPB10)